MKTKLSDRIRPNSEAAPWVIEEIKELELSAENFLECIELMREAIKVASDALETVSRLPIARSYPDGPCLEIEDHKEVTAAIIRLQPFLPK